MLGSRLADGARTLSLFFEAVGGMWLLQACIRSWSSAGDAPRYEDLLAAAEDDTLAFQSLFDPDHSTFFNPKDMPSAIAAFCQDTVTTGWLSDWENPGFFHRPSLP